MGHPALDGTDAAFVSAIVKSAPLLRGNMPPFWGNAGEADLIAGYIHRRGDARPLGEIYGLQGVELGRKVFEVRCGKCHTPGTPGDKTGSLAGLSESDYGTMLDSAADLGEGMPAFTGDAAERGALIQHLKTLGEGATK